MALPGYMQRYKLNKKTGFKDTVSERENKISKRLNSAKTVAEKIKIIDEEIETFPDFSVYHALEKELVKKRELYLKHEKKTKKHSKYEIRKQGIGTICLIGFPSAGKSTLMKLITNADPEVAEYAFTTKQPYSGMVQMQGFQYQLIEIPGLMSGAAEGYGKGKQFLAIARNSDALCFLIALNQKPLEKLGMLKKEFKKANINKPSITVGTKSDLASSLPGILCINHKQNLNQLKEQLFKMLGKIRVHTKEPREEPDLSQPLILKKGSKVSDFAKKLEIEFSYAKLWGSAKYDGQMISKKHILEDGDVVELHP